MTMMSQFGDMKSSSKFYWRVLFLLSSLVTALNFMRKSASVLELWQCFLRNWPEIRKSEIAPSEFCPIFGDWDKLRIPNLARMFLMKCYYMLQNVRVPAFTVSELLSESQQGDKITPPLHAQIMVKSNKESFINWNFDGVFQLLVVVR